jgi:hypothetical protein
MQFAASVLSLVRQQALGLFGRNMPEAYKCRRSIVGFYLDGLVCPRLRLFIPDAFRRVDNARKVCVGSVADYDLDAVLATLHVGADAYKWERRTGSTASAA